MILTDDDITALKSQIRYNAHNLGELGTFIRVSYALAAIDQMVARASSENRA